MPSTDTLAHSLERIASALEQDADQLRRFAAQVRVTDAADLKDSPIHSNVVLLVGRVLNNSGWISSAEAALHSAAELARGRE